MTVTSEVLSLFGEIKASNVLVFWFVLAAAVWIAATVARPVGAFGRRRPANREWPHLPYAVACAIILGATLLVAVIAPPNYADALTYHMGRVAHWIQAGSLDYFRTGITRQNYQMPFAEYVILHLQLLSGGDRWANLVQWAAFALCGVTVSLVLADLGQSARIQWTGALVALTIPMAILEASGAQNDLVVSLWLLAFLLYLWRGLSDRSWEIAVLCGLALGLALATKGTAYLYAPAMAGVLVLGRVARAGPGLRFPPIRNVVAACLVAMSLNLGPWSRSVTTYGKPLCCGDSYFVERLTPGDAVSNLLRNTALHLGVPKLTGVVEHAVEVISPVDVDDPATSMGAFDISFSYNEGKAGNTLHLVVILAAGVALILNPRLRRGPAIIWLLAVVSGFVAFSLALNWQSFASRLHTPVFIVASIPVAIAIGSLGRRIAASVLALLFGGSLFYVFLNHQRPILPMLHPSILAVPRVDQYLPEYPASQAAYEQAAEFVRTSGEAEVGLLFDELDYEYVLWVLVKEDFAGPPILRHVGVEPLPGSAPPPPPPAIVVTSFAGDRHRIDGFDYDRIRDFGPLSILRRSGRPSS